MVIAVNGEDVGKLSTFAKTKSETLIKTYQVLFV